MHFLQATNPDVWHFCILSFKNLTQFPMKSFFINKDARGTLLIKSWLTTKDYYRIFFLVYNSSYFFFINMKLFLEIASRLLVIQIRDLSRVHCDWYHKGSRILKLAWTVKLKNSMMRWCTRIHKIWILIFSTLIPGSMSLLFYLIVKSV